MSKNVLQGPSPDGARAIAARYRRRAGSIAVVVALHVAVLWMLGSVVGPRPGPRPSRAPVAMVQVDPAPMTWAPGAPSAPRSETRTVERTPARASAARATSPTPDRPALPLRDTRITRAASAPSRTPMPTPSPATVPATAPVDAPAPIPAPGAAPLQRTIRKEALHDLSSGSRPWQDDPRLASKSPASVGSRLEAGTAAAARGDCLRGEFKGRDMGLLSLPMLGLAAAQGRCALP